MSLTIGYTKDIRLAEKIARATGAKELSIETRPEGDTLLLDEKEQARWRRRGWTLEGRTARKTLGVKSAKDESVDKTKKDRKSEMQSVYTSEGHTEVGRLKASMLL